MATAFAPGRTTLVGEHVDYADGLVVCTAVDLGIAAAVRRAPAGVTVRSGSESQSLAAGEVPAPGSLAERPLAVVEALRRAGVDVPPVDVALVSSLPAGAGLSSSAALSCAVAAALLRLVGERLPAAALAELALVAERDIVGIPCGPLDMRAVVHTPAAGVLLLDCRDGGVEPLPALPAGEVLVAADSGGRHDVGGAGYRARRREADDARAALARPWRVVAQVAAEALPQPLALRARHIVTETGRARDAAAALRGGDAARLGALMSASHLSLRNDYEVSTPALDAVVAAAIGVEGCRGARLVGAGFGGTAVALVRAQAAEACAAAMASAARPHGGGGTWRLSPGPGLAALAPDVVT